MRKSYLQWIYSLLLIMVASLANAQDWQSAYNKALEQYQAEQYQKSLVLAEEALEKSKSQSPTSRAHTLQLVTSNCIMLSQADKGLKFIDEEISLFQQVEGQHSKSLAEAKKKQVLFLQQKGLPKEALEKCAPTLSSFEDSYGKDALQTTLFVSLTAEITLAKGDSTAAKKIWGDCLARLATSAEGKEEYKSLLLNAAALDENLRAPSDAEIKYATLISLLEKDNQNEEEIYKEAKAGISRLKSPSGSAKSPVSAGGELESLLKRAAELQSNHQVDKALEIYTQASELASINEVRNRTAFSIFFNKARLQLENGDVKNAEQSFQKAKQLSGSLFKPTDAEIILADLTEADILLTNAQTEKAVDKYNALSGRLSKDNASRSVSYVLSSAQSLINTNLTGPALKLMRPLLCCIPTPLTGAYVSVVSTYCDGLLAENKPDSVLSFLNRSSFSQLPLSIEMKRIEAMQQKGQSQQALDKLKSMEAQATTSQDKGDIAYQHARVAYQMGDYSTAEREYQKTLNFYSQSDREQAWQVGNSLAILYSKLGNYDKSERTINDLLAKVPENHPLHASLLSNLVANYIETNQLEKAERGQEKIVVHEKQIGQNKPDYAQALTNMAAIYQKQKRYPDAKRLLETALAVSKNNFGELSIDYAMKESNLGATLKDMGDFTNARITLEHALKVLSEKLGVSHPDYVSCEYNLALVQVRLGNSAQAAPLMQHLGEFYKKQTLNLFPAMSEHEQVAFYNKINRPVQDYLQFAIESGEGNAQLVGQLIDFRLATKALLLNSSVKIRERILAGNDQKLKEQLLQWLTLKDQLGKLYGAGKTDVALETRSNDLEKSISSGSSVFKIGNEERATNWKKIQSSLQPNEAAIEFIRVKASGQTDSITYAAVVIVKNSDNPRLIVFKNGKNMEGREFSYLKNNIIHQQPNDRSFGIFWKPLEAVLKDARSIYFSADGVYNKINLATIFDPTRQEFLSSRYKFILVSNLREITASASGTQALVHTAQLFGPVHFGDYSKTVSTTRSFASIVSEKMPDLPGTKVEIEKVDQVLKSATWSTTARMEEQATERNLKEMQSSAVVHIATHGFFVHASDDDKPAVVSPSGESENPLFQSGLVLSDIASSADQNEDGMLTAYEVKNLNFSKTDLVVLSACETGSGEIRNGEGVYGLQRAFMLCGARSILMSLWKVDDLATQELMVLFYTKFLAGQNKIDALRSAQADLMKKYPAPYYWGSFVLIGKP